MYNCTHCPKATDEKDGSGNLPMSNFLDTIEVQPKIKKLLRNANKSIIGI
jgi:hypothetical protein